MLECDFCGCHTTQPGEGWAAYHRDNPEGIGEPRVAVFCPPCAAARHALLPEVAATYVRVTGDRASFAAPAHLSH
jgi:hypothetical protein